MFRPRLPACFLPLVAVAACATTPPPAAPQASSTPPPPPAASAASSAPSASDAPSPAPAADAPTSYDAAPPGIRDVLHAPTLPTALVSPTRDAILLVAVQDYPPIAPASRPRSSGLPGSASKPKNHSRHDTPGGYGITPCATDFTLVRLPDGAETPVDLPHGCPGAPLWAADGKRFTFVYITADSVVLWVGDAP